MLSHNAIFVIRLIIVVVGVFCVEGIELPIIENMVGGNEWTREEPSLWEQL